MFCNTKKTDLFFATLLLPVFSTLFADEDITLEHRDLNHQKSLESKIGTAQLKTSGTKLTKEQMANIGSLSAMQTIGAMRTKPEDIGTGPTTGAAPIVGRAGSLAVVDFTRVPAFESVPGVVTAAQVTQWRRTFLNSLISLAKKTGTYNNSQWTCLKAYNDANGETAKNAAADNAFEIITKGTQEPNIDQITKIINTIELAWPTGPFPGRAE